MRAGMSGGTVASASATMEAIRENPALLRRLVDPFVLTPGFAGPRQPRGDKLLHDPDLDAEVTGFAMAVVNTKNVHRSNFLLGHPYGTDFVYDEMAVVADGVAPSFGEPAARPPGPGEGPSKEQRDAGFYDLLFLGIDRDGGQVRAAVHGDRDPGYGSTSKILAETALCLVQQCPEVRGGIWVPGAAMGQRLVERLPRAGLTFSEETP
jgi:short subunit dehydrogenase-like uncharacterized protein